MDPEALDLAEGLLSEIADRLGEGSDSRLSAALASLLLQDALVGRTAGTIGDLSCALEHMSSRGPTAVRLALALRERWPRDTPLRAALDPRGAERR